MGTGPVGKGEGRPHALVLSDQAACVHHAMPQHSHEEDAQSEGKSSLKIRLDQDQNTPYGISEMHPFPA